MGNVVCVVLLICRRRRREEDEEDEEQAIGGGRLLLLQVLYSGMLWKSITCRIVSVVRSWKERDDFCSGDVARSALASLGTNPAQVSILRAVKLFLLVTSELVKAAPVSYNTICLALTSTDSATAKMRAKWRKKRVRRLKRKRRKTRARSYVPPAPLGTSSTTSHH